MPFSVSRSPIVGMVWTGSRKDGERCGSCGPPIGSSVLTAKPSGVTAPSASSTPALSTLATIRGGAFGYTGVHAQTSQKWLRKEPPNAA
jgi:hypothetical protein